MHNFDIGYTIYELKIFNVPVDNRWIMIKKSPYIQKINFRYQKPLRYIGFNSRFEKKLY